MTRDRTYFVAAVTWMAACATGCFPDVGYATPHASTLIDAGDGSNTAEVSLDAFADTSDDSTDAANASSDAGDGPTDKTEASLDAFTETSDGSTDAADASSDAGDGPTDKADGPADKEDSDAHANPTEDMVLISPALQGFDLVEHRLFDNDPLPAATVTLTRPFHMDRYEVTTGRFKAWVDAGRPLPCDNCSLDDGGPYASDMVWHAAWTTAYSPQLDHGYGDCYSPLRNPIDTPWAVSSANDTWTYPISCVTWFDAVAFCHWEGKRLPTLAEWVYAARGGPAAQTYPWGEASPSSCTDSTFNPADASTPYCDFPIPVGSAERDVSPFGIRDLGGSVFEWVWDVDWTLAALPATMSDYIGPEDGSSDSGIGPMRCRKGGAFIVPFTEDDTRMKIDVFEGFDPLDSYTDAGFRCVRSASL